MFQSNFEISDRTSLISSTHSRSLTQRWEDPKNNNSMSKKESSRSLSMEENTNGFFTPISMSPIHSKDMFLELLPSVQLLSHLIAENSVKLSEIFGDNSLDTRSSTQFDSLQSFLDVCISGQVSLKDRLNKYSERSILAQLQKEKETKGEIISQIHKVKHDIILANVEIKQYHLNIDKLQKAIDSLEEITSNLPNFKDKHVKSILKSPSYPMRELSEDSSQKADSSFISYREDKDEESTVSEKRHLLSCDIKELKNKDMLWSDFGDKVYMLIEEIDRQKCTFDALPIIKEKLRLLKVQNKNKSKSVANADSFISHMIQTPALVEYHFESMAEELNEKEETILSYKRELDTAKDEIERLKKSNLDLKDKVTPEKKPTRVIQRRPDRSNNRDSKNRLITNPLDGLEEVLKSQDHQNLEQALLDAINKIFLRCKNLFSSYTGFRNRLESNQQLLIKLKDLSTRLGRTRNPFEEISDLISQFNEGGFVHLMTEKIKVLCKPGPENSEELLEATKEHDKRWSLITEHKSVVLEHCAGVSIQRKSAEFDILSKLDNLSEKVNNIARSFHKMPVQKPSEFIPIINQKNK